MKILLATLLAGLCFWSPPAEAKRVALVIANAAYRNVTPLATPGNDGRLVADALAASGFDVQLGANLGKTQLEAAIQEFAIDAAGADVAVVYYAGHGLEAGGQNWLIPVDAGIAAAADVDRTSVPFTLVARALAGAGVKIVALDACRDSPFAARLQDGGTLNRGLGEMELDGYVVMYAAAAGAVALDGRTNSPFAQAFAHWVGAQNIDLRLLAGSIRDDVIAATSGAQRPFVSASLPGGVTTLGPVARGAVRDAATARTRTPRTFSLARTLVDPSCVRTTTVKCASDRMISGGGRIATLDDDEKVRIWDAESGRALRTELALASSHEATSLDFVSAPSAFLMTMNSTVASIPSGAGAAKRQRLEHGDNPAYMLVTSAPAIAVFDYPVSCGFGFVDTTTLSLLGRTNWASYCIGGEVAWSFPEPGSDRFVASVRTITRDGTRRETIVGAARTRAIVCRVPGDANDAAFGPGGDLYLAQDDGAVTRYDGACRLKNTWRLHAGAIEQLGAVAGGRMISKAADGSIKVWSAATGAVEREVSGLDREAYIANVSDDGSIVMVQGEDRRLHFWYGEPRLGPYAGPAAPVCAASLSSDNATLFALRCEGNVEVWRRDAIQ